MIDTHHQAILKAAGQIEGHRNEIERLKGKLETVSQWKPASVLRRQCEEVTKMIYGLEKRLEKKLVITILGPCGSGKSTILNALSGVDGLSPSGDDRPTTNGLNILAKQRTDAEMFLDELGKENVRICSNTAAVPLEHVLLVDTPDTDSSEREFHIPMVHKAIGLSDILICVFDSENPKRMDYIDFLSSYVEHFRGESIICVLNRCDRMDETELRTKILPEFAEYIHNAWEKNVERILCISARRHLKDPKWDPKAPPRHDFDQFGSLKEIIFGTFDRAGFVVDKRIEHANELKSYISREIRSETGKHKERLKEARKKIELAEAEAITGAMFVMKGGGSHRLGINVMLYQKLSQAWVGPVGWLVAIWARILVFGSGFAAMFRFGNPLSQAYGIVSSLKNFKESKAAVAEAGKGKQVESALRSYRKSWLTNWPDIAELLISCGFDSSIKQIEGVLSDPGEIGGELAEAWTEALDESMERSTRALSGIFLLTLFNLPVIAILCYSGWIISLSFLEGKYLTSNFFLHALVVVLIILFLSFFFFQACVRLFAGPEKISRKTFETVKQRMDLEQRFHFSPMFQQVETILELSTIPGQTEPQMNTD